MADRYFQTNFGRSNRVNRPDFSSQFNIPNSTDTDTDWELSKMYEEPLKRYRGIISEEMPALQRLRSLGALLPQREEYEPGFGGKLSAALAGFASGFGNPAQAYQTAVNAREAPYRRALEDFGMEKEIVGEQAELERYDRQNRLSGAKAELESIDDMLTQQRQYMDSQSQDKYRQLQGGNLTSQMADREARFGLDVDKFKFETDTKFPAEQGIREGQLGVSQRNANTSAGQLGVSRDRLGLDAQQFEFDKLHKDRTFGVSRDRADAYTDYLGRGRSSSTPSPDAQIKARAMAAKDLLNLNSGYSKYINAKGEYVNKGWGQGYGKDDTNFLKFKADFEKEVDKILGRTFNYDDLPEG